MALLGVSLAPTDTWNEANPSWERIDTTYQVQSWRIDRGRVFEFDRTDTGRASVDLVDEQGDFDPTNPTGAYNSLVLRQAGIALQNPVDSSWSTLFRGYVQRVEWIPYQTMGFANVRLHLVDALALLAAAEMTPDGTFGDAVENGNIIFGEDLNTNAVQRRIGDGTTYTGVLSQWGWPTSLREIFTGNVKLQRTVYAPRTPVLNVLTDAADAEFPTAANVYVQKDGTITFHGRLARFDHTDPQYHITTWELGDDAAALLDPANIVRISPPLLVSQDDQHLYTAALATPQNIDDADIAGQYAEDSTAVTQFGYRTWSAENLLTAGGASSATALQVTALFRNYIRDNFATPRTRVGAITIRPQSPSSIWGSATWDIMCNVDISDVAQLTTTHNGGGGFSDEFFIEGIHYEAKPMSATQKEVTLTLDVSPAGYYTTDPFS